MYKPNPVPRVAAIHDLSGFGRSSLTTVIPILSTMGIQACPVPTAILSTHTSEFKNYHFVDLTDELDSFINHWKSLAISFDAIYSGFLGSARQVDTVKRFISDFKRENQIVVVDPVLGDDGETYDTITMEMVNQMESLTAMADVITPNATEAALLLKESPDLPNDAFTSELIKDWLVRLSKTGPEIVIITSIPVIGRPKLSSVVAYEKTSRRFWQVQCTYIPAYFPGTGDIFTSVMTGSLLRGQSLPIALDRSVQFVTQAIRASFGHDYPRREGVLLEAVLDNLRAPIINTSYELF
ncbi:MAG: pyridoxamine kinase [Spirochaetales bacterium]|uniref:pyridoxal kinase n=1 Tax=Candidatus Thalassospirochaeta sargassi TaxID=3119039 RepID=A0AAJ1MPS5_9SPIO|nr:pyridoxamine kinase [Spirochaetales bacterium]